jgi:hypothetical protein
MKKKSFIMCTALMWTTFLMAQNISVVNTDGSTQVYTTLADAIGGAGNGSTIYLPGGRFAISDDVKITKKVTIIGIGHYLNGEGNEDGYTRIEGNLWFNENSSSSAVMGCYITGQLEIGENDAEVNDLTIKFCNFKSVQVKNNKCKEMVVNQCYVREGCNFGQSQNVTISNNVIRDITWVGSGIIRYNVVTDEGYGTTFQNISNCVIEGNVIRGRIVINTGGGCSLNNNLAVGRSYGDNPIIIDATDVDLFENPNRWAVSPVSNFHFKSEYSQYEHQVGIYAGSGFSDKQLAPVPYIVDKQVASETDASGKLNIKIRVKASE